MSDNSILYQAVHTSMNAYFAALEGQTPTNLHALVTDEVERALLMFMMARTGNNKSLTARWLGITRNTLNSKLEQHGIADLYRPSKGETSHA